MRCNICPRAAVSSLTVKPASGMYAYIATYIRSSGIAGVVKSMVHRLRQRGFFACVGAIGLLLGTSVFYVASPIFSRHYHKYPGEELATSKTGECEVIDVVISVNGQESCNHAILLIKSILLFRRGPIRLHLLVDSTARHVMGTLLRTWHLFGLEYHLYQTDWTSSGPQGNFSFIPHILESLPLSVERVISIQPEVLVSADLNHLWNTFSKMGNEDSVFGLVRIPLSASVGELKDEVMFLDLKQMRLKNLPQQLWKKGHSRRLSLSRTLHLLYQQDPTLFHLLSPGWSVFREQSGVHSEPCLQQQTACVHSSVGASDVKTLIQDYDGNMLREKWIDCQTGPTFDQNAINYRAKTSVYAPPCTDFKREGNQERRTHPFYAGQWLDPHSPQSSDVTLTLHGTLDRLVPMLEPMCRHWEGPMSIAVFANDSEMSGFLDLIQSSPVIRARHNIAYHMVYKEGVYYPINTLRVTAMQNVGTDYVFMNDMDFLPSFGLYSYIKESVREFDLNHTVLIVPAFETYEDHSTFTFPRDKSTLLEMELEDRVFQFHRTDYIRGHAPTDYPKWRRAKEPYEILWKRYYEPYLVASRNITPLDPRFVSRDFNKVSHIEHLHYQHYKFYVLSGGFILHLPHQLSSDAKNQKANDRHGECYTRRRDEWRAEKVQQYGHESYLKKNVYKIWNMLSNSYETSF